MNKEKLITFFKKETILCISGVLAFVSAFIIQGGRRCVKAKSAIFHVFPLYVPGKMEYNNGGKIECPEVLLWKATVLFMMNWN